MASIIKVDQIEPNSQQMLSMRVGGVSNYISPNYVGQISSFRIRRTTSQAFPFWNLSLPDQNLSATLYPDYVDYLRGIKIETCLPIQFAQTVNMSGTTATFTASLSSTLTVGTLLYFHASGQFRIIVGVTSNTVYTLDEALSGSALVVSLIDQSQYSSTFSGISGTPWSGTTFTLADNAQNKILLDALLEDAYYGGGSFNSGTNVMNPSPNWMVLRWGTTDINIISFNAVARTINVASGTPSGTTIELYPHRIAGSIDARHKHIDDSVLINNGIQVVSGLRLRDRMQGHVHNVNFQQGGSYGISGASQYTFNTNAGSSTSPLTDGTNGTPRTGQFTRPRGLGVIFYEYCGRVN
jgi:hypothetical protein